MAPIPKSISINVDLVISDRTAIKMCELLSDYLNEHWNMELETIMIQADNEIRREIRLVEKE